ncbi:MAG: hypothetical protein JNK73_11975 [Bacteroidia bacterium]|nr:hypothetical protein [Bacteroidia bacterium]
MNSSIQLQKIRIQQIEEGIVENYFLSGESIEVEDFRELKQANIELMGQKPYTVLVTAEELTSFTREAREYVASKEYVGITIAKALLISGLGQRIIGNFYMKVNKPNIKTKLFSDRDKAIEWLRKEYRQHINRVDPENHGG